MTNANYTLTGTLPSPGTITLTLEGWRDGILIVIGSGVIASDTITATDSGSGWSITVFGNDQLSVNSVTGTTYYVYQQTVNGMSSVPAAYKLTGGGTHNINSLTPIVPPNL